MNISRKNILLTIVVVIIISVIFYIESHKSSQHNAVATGEVQTINVISKTEKNQIYTPAHELIPGGGFINSDPFKLKDFIGKKVVLLDFWTYSCINCQRTIPYLNAWYEKYKDQGLVIVGVHSPEFDFEKQYANVVKAVQQFGIKYPVVQDNNMATWQAYQNQYWPHEYLIDIDGYVVHDKIGEGGYADTEQAIQHALAERAQVLHTQQTLDMHVTTPQDVVAIDPSKVQSPETYFGSARNEYLANGKSGVNGSQTLTVPASLSVNQLYLNGNWNFQSEYAESTSITARIIFKYNSKNVYFVASSAKGVNIKILRDGKPLGAEAGKDVASDGAVTIKDNRLYELIKGSDYGEHTIEIQVEGSGLDAFTFTFG